jgi:SAM-dependent methyltransferase
MPQGSIWEKEYQQPKLLAPTNKPQKGTLKFFKYLRKKHDVKLEDGPCILDIGSGNGRNANHLAHMGASVSGIEISGTAVQSAQDAAREQNVKVDYKLGNFGAKFPFENDAFDIAIDVTSSNSLNEEERKIYLTELDRTLKPGGFFFLKTLCLDGDKNAKNLLKQSPGPEKNTYVMKEIGLVERVFTREEIVDIYTPYFDILELTKKESYTRMNGKSYKRMFWVGYFKHHG